MVTLKNDPVKLIGVPLQAKQKAPDFELVDESLKRVSLSAFEGQIKIFNCVPSLDTDVCAKSFIEFQRRVAPFQNCSLLHISKDLPFAAKRFCESKQVKKALTLSCFDSSFGKDYGLEIVSGPLKGLLTRWVALVSPKNEIIYAELVAEITEEPNYGALIENLENYLNQ